MTLRRWFRWIILSGCLFLVLLFFNTRSDPPRNAVSPTPSIHSFAPPPGNVYYTDLSYSADSSHRHPSSSSSSSTRSASPSSTRSASPPSKPDPNFCLYESGTKAIATASSKNHYLNLLWLLATVRLHEPTVPIYVYDLGLEDRTPHVQALSLLSSGLIRYCPFPYHLYPAYLNVSIKAGEYAWKPVIIERVLSLHNYVIWLDAGDVLYQPLQGSWELLEETGFLSTDSGGTVTQWTHPGVFRYLGISDEVVERLSLIPNCNAAYLGFGRERSYRQLVLPWVRCALVRECIAPEGSSRANHRQDQAVLTVLVYTSDPALQFRCGAYDNSVTIHNDGRVLNVEQLFRMPFPISLHGMASFRAASSSSSPSSSFSLSSSALASMKTSSAVATGLDFLGVMMTMVATPWDPVTFLGLGGEHPAARGNALAVCLLGPLCELTIVGAGPPASSSPSSSSMALLPLLQQLQPKPRNLAREAKEGELVDWSHSRNDTGAQPLLYYRPAKGASKGWPLLGENRVRPCNLVYLSMRAGRERARLELGQVLAGGLLAYSKFYFSWTVFWDHVEGEEDLEAVRQMAEVLRHGGSDFHFTTVSFEGDTRVAVATTHSAENIAAMLRQ
ncbi:Glycosyltransferase [Balamuthia mandrillaris]